MCSTSESMNGSRRRRGRDRMNAHRLRTTIEASRGLAVLSALALIGCSSITHSNVANSNKPSNSNVAVEDQNNKSSGDALDSRLVAGNERFGFKLFAAVTKQDAGKNVFISPASVGLALAMTYNGAEGETKLAMSRALEAQGMSLDELNR